MIPASIKPSEKETGFMSSPLVRPATLSESVDAEYAAHAARANDRSPAEQVGRLSNDLADWPDIPASVRDAFSTFRDVAKDRHAALMRASDELRDELEKRTGFENRLRLISSETVVRSGSSIDESHPGVVQCRGEIAQADARIARLNPRYEGLQAAWHWAGHLVRNNLERYLRAHAGGVKLYQGVKPQLQNGETALDGRERAERRTRALFADRDQVRAAPFPVALAKRRARDEIAKRAEAAAPDVSSLVDYFEEIDFPTNRIGVQEHGGSAASVRVVDAVGLLAWLLPKEFGAAIDKAIEAAGDEKAALSPEQRLAKLQQIDRDILASEREEAHFSELAGLLPRPDIDPRAALWLADDMPAPRRPGEY